MTKKDVNHRFKSMKLYNSVNFSTVNHLSKILLTYSTKELKIQSQKNYSVLGGLLSKKLITKAEL